MKTFEQSVPEIQEREILPLPEEVPGPVIMNTPIPECNDSDLGSEQFPGKDNRQIYH